MTKGHQLRDVSKVKSWLFTTLHRSFLESRRRRVRFPHFELNDINVELPTVTPETVSGLDCAEVLKALAQVDEIYQAAIALFYLEDFSYKEIAAVLEIPIGTVKSRMARGLYQLRQILEAVPREKRPDAFPRRDTQPGDSQESRC